MGKDETWFWSKEPKFIFAIINAKNRIEKDKLKAQAYYIVACISGENLEEFDKPKEILGIDKPVNPEMLRGFD